MAVHRTVHDGVATLTFSRPERHNSFDVEAAADLDAAVRLAVEDGEVRAIVLTGAGDAFCVGADVKAMAADPARAPASIRDMASRLHDAIDHLHRGPKPVVTAVNGDAAGGGFGLALAGDLRLASERARFRPAYFRIGLTPDGGLTYFLTRYAGLAQAQRILLLDETLDAEAARRLGLVHAVVPPDKLVEEAEKIARVLAAWSTTSVAGTKKLLGHAWDRASAAQMEKELEEIVLAGSSEGFREGLRAFVEKRSARFV